MKKTLSKLLALALTASLVLSGCGGNAESGNNEANSQGGQANAEGSDKKEEASSKDEIKDLYIASQEDSENLTSLVDGLQSPIQRVSWFHVSQKSGAAKMAV